MIIIKWFLTGVKNSPFQQMTLRPLETHSTGIKLGPYLTLHTKINSKCIKDLNLRDKTIKLLEKNIGVNRCDLGSGNGVLARTSKAQTTTKDIDKWNCV